MTSELLLMHRVECGDATFDEHITLAQSLLSRGANANRVGDRGIRLLVCS